MRRFLVLTLCLFLLFSSLSLAESQTTLRIAGRLDSLNLFFLRDFQFWDRIIVSAIWEPLYVWSPQFQRLIPWLANGEPIIDANEKTVTIHLKRGIHWSANEVFTQAREFTAKDVVFTYKTHLEFGLDLLPFAVSWSSAFEILLKAINNVTEVDKYTVRFEMQEHTPLLQYCGLTWQIIPSHQWGPIVEEARTKTNPGAFITNFSFTPSASQPLPESVGKPIGTGPYTLDSWNEDEMILVKRNDYTPPVQEIEINGQLGTLGPYIDRIQVKGINNSDRTKIEMVQKDVADVGFLVFQGNRIDPFMIPELDASETMDVHSSRSNMTLYFEYNQQKEPFNDTAFRKATRILIDELHLIRESLNGYGEESYSVIAPANSNWYNPDTPAYGKGLNRVDRIQEAVRVLEGAGYTWGGKPVIENGELVRKGQRLILPNGEAMELFTIIAPAWDISRQLGAIHIQQWLEDIGVFSVVVYYDVDRLVQALYEGDETWDANVMAFAEAPIYPYHLYEFCYPYEDDELRGYSSQRCHELGEEFMWSMDEARQHELAFELQEMIGEDLPLIVLHFRNQIDVVNNRFTGWVEQLDGFANMWSLFLVKPYE